VAQGLAKGAARAQAAATGVILPGRGASLAPLRGPPGSRARSSEPCFRGRGETPAHPRSSVGPLTAIRLPHGPKTHDRMRDCERREHPGGYKDHRDPELGTASQPGLHIRDVTNLRAIKPRTRTGLSESLSARQSGGVNLGLQPTIKSRALECATVIRNALECARGFSGLEHDGWKSCIKVRRLTSISIGHRSHECSGMFSNEPELGTVWAQTRQLGFHSPRTSNCRPFPSHPTPRPSPRPSRLGRGPTGHENALRATRTTEG
jgi:hypothetical protein